MSNIIWTKHAKERNKERQITQNWIEKTISHPDNFSKVEGGKLKSIKNFGKHQVTTITTLSKSGEYLILSAWVNPPIVGTTDYKIENYKKGINKSSIPKKFIKTLLNQIGF